MNAKEEFENHVKDKQVMCAEIIYSPYFVRDSKEYYLKVGFTVNEYFEFLESLDFEYDNGFGTQEIYGNIWYKDGTWSTREDYDGSEWWEYRLVPKIPDECSY